MTNLPIHTFTGIINNHSVELISAREVHELLQIKTPFHKWIARRLYETRFRENLDFTVTDKIVRLDRGVFGMRDETIKEYHLTLRMAEHLCLMENNEIGDRIRDLFIEREEQARNEIPRLQAENAKLSEKLGRIPPFLLSNPDHTTAIIKRAQQAFFTLHPECRELLRYREMGLTNAEIGKLIGLSRDAVRKRLTKLFNLGLANPKNGNQHAQLVLNLA